MTEWATGIPGHTIRDHEHEPVHRETRDSTHGRRQTVIEDCADDGCDWWRVRRVERTTLADFATAGGEADV